MESGEGLWIVPCPMIHTFFMRFPIDVLFLDKRLRVVRVLAALQRSLDQSGVPVSM